MPELAIQGVAAVATESDVLLAALRAAQDHADKHFGSQSLGALTQGSNASNVLSDRAMSAEIGAYGRAFKAVQAQWETLEADRRRESLQQLVGAQLQRSGVPAVVIRTDITGSAGNASFGFANWELIVDEATMKWPTLNDADAKELAETVCRRGRHAEQWFRMAQLLAADGMSAQRIRDRMGIPGKVAAAAVADRLQPGDRRRAYASELYDSVYGEKSQARQTVLGALDAAGAMLKATRYKLAAVTNEPAVPASLAAKAEDDFRVAHAAFTQAEQAYRTLPEEADAAAAASLLRGAW
jgi:hypothetical protein